MNRLLSGSSLVGFEPYNQKCSTHGRHGFDLARAELVSMFE